MRRLAVSGLISTRSTLSHLESRSAASEKNGASRRFSGILIRSLRLVKWLIRAAGRLGIRQTSLLPPASAQPHHLVFCAGLVSNPGNPALGLVFGARLCHQIAGQFPELGCSFAPPLV